MTKIHKRIEAEIPRLRRYARALVRDVVGADDLVQECLSRALAKLDLWREGTDLRAWLFTILHNQYVNHVRRSVRTGAMVQFDDPASQLSQPASQEKRLELRDLDRALGQLPPEQRMAILLVGLEGLPYAEVGKALGSPIGTVRSRLSRGRLALRQLMEIDPDRRSATTVRASRRKVVHLPTKAPEAGDTASNRWIGGAGDRRCSGPPNRETLINDGRPADHSPKYPALSGTSEARPPYGGNPPNPNRTARRSTGAAFPRPCCEVEPKWSPQ